MERRFVKDYEYNGGEWVYRGKTYSVAASRELRARVAASACVNIFLFICAGFSGNMMTRWWPVGVPFAVLIITLALFAYYAARFYKLPVDMERRHYEGAFIHIGVYTAVNFALAAVAAGAGAAWIFKTEGFEWTECLTPFFFAGISAVSFMCFKNWRALNKNVHR